MHFRRLKIEIFSDSMVAVKIVTNRIKNLNKIYKITSKWLLNELNNSIEYRENKRYEINLYLI
jgi:hypothetical protein